MSKCISSEGEYSDHELAEQPRFMCARCFAFDEDAALAALDEAERERAATDKAFSALKQGTGKADSERIELRRRAEAAEATLERVRAAIALCYPDDMTPAAKRVLDAALAPVTEEGDGNGV